MTDFFSLLRGLMAKRVDASEPLELYKRLAEQCQQNLERSLRDHSQLHLTSTELLDSLSLWVAELSVRPEQGMLLTALRELRFGILACGQGQYRQAYMALRMSLELGTAAIHYSVREVELREWQAGNVDMKWGAFHEEKDGAVFSPRFTAACSPSLVTDANNVKGLAKTVYRECSDFVHGGPKSSATLPDDLRFDEAYLKRWHAHFGIALSILTFVMLARYSQYSEIIGTVSARAAVTTILSGMGAAIAIVEGASGTKI